MGGNKSGEETWRFVFTEEKALRILLFTGFVADSTPG